MPYRAGLILGQIPLCTELNVSQITGIARGGGKWAVLELTCTLVSALKRYEVIILIHIV